ncbi:RIM-binding protein of the cytomatrix active zone domain-containing protein [Ditylenchus destructor]|nr:RIM-binding protein of the cytomatrix active zone domain-containing protein [Ditylenchus destructor]
MNSFGANEQHDASQSIRKHRSLDGAQFLNQLDHPPPPPPTTMASNYDNAYHHHQMYGTTDGSNPGGYLRMAISNSTTSPTPQNSAKIFHLHSRLLVTVSALLHREFASMEQKLNYVMNTIRSFWSPELKKERQLRKEEAMRTNALQYKLCQQATEIQQVRAELEKREKEIGQLLSESDLGDMEEELRRLRKQMREPRDFTDKHLSVHELQTMKTKMERSELTLSEKSRDLTNCEVRLKCAEETAAAHESQLKLLHDDLDVLRKKLETKNQLLESKEKSIKSTDKELDNAKNQLQEAVQYKQDSDHRISSLAHRIEQLETLLRERDAQMDRLKQRLMQQPGTRHEKELQLRAENAEHDKNNLEKMMESLKQDAEADIQQQLQTFQEESQQLNKTIDYLQKELNDRHMLIASQNEKICQLDTQSKTREFAGDDDGKSEGRKIVKVLEADLEETRREVERLLCIMRTLEKEKGQLAARLNESSQNNKNIDGTTVPMETLVLDGDKTDDSRALKLRIEELEEALRESVGQTTERDKIIAEQKPLIQQLSAQINELYKVSGSRVDQKALQNAIAKAEAIQRQLEEERVIFQRQLSNLRKEVSMEVIKEKEACIALLQSPPDSISEKIDILTRQKEHLKHRLLTQGSHAAATVGVGPSVGFSTTEGGPYLGNAWQSMSKGTLTQSGIGQMRTAPLNVAVSMGVGASAPASLLNYGMREDADDDGIWA